MEVFAFTHAAAAFEDQGPEPQLRRFDELNLEVPKSALLGVAGTAAALSIMATAPEAQAVVRPGESCPAVGSIQQALLNAGFSPGGIDSVYGPNTAAAVRNFQSFRGLLADGIVGPATAGALGLNTGISCGGGTGGGGGGFYTVTSPSGVVLRSGPGLGFAVVGSAGSGDRLELTTERVARDGYLWGRLVTGNWVATDFLVAGGGTGGNGGTGGTGGGGSFVVTASSGLAVRTGPGLGNSVLYYAANGSTLSLTSERVFSDGFTWARLTTGGWTATNFLTAGGGTGGGTGGGNLPSGSGTFFVDASSGVNVRSTPSLGGGVLYSVGPGQTVTITSERVASDGYLWARLTSGGWIATNFLS